MSSIKAKEFPIPLLLEGVTFKELVNTPKQTACSIPVSIELLDVLCKIYHIIIAFTKLLEVNVYNGDIVLFGGAIMHIFANAMGKSLPLNDFDFLVKINQSDEINVEKYIKIFKFTPQLILDGYVVNIKLNYKDGYPTKNMCKCSVIIDYVEYSFDIVFVTKIDSIDGLPFSSIKMIFSSTSGPVIRLDNLYQYWNLIQFYQGKPLTFPTIHKLIEKRINVPLPANGYYNSNYLQEIKQNYLDIKQYYLVIQKAIDKGISICGISQGTCVHCKKTVSELELDDHEKIMRSILIPLCQNTEKKCPNMCIVCLSFNKPYIQNCPLKCGYSLSNDDFDKIFFVHENITDFLSLPFNWNILTFEKKI